MVFGWFSKDKTSNLQKTIERATNKLAQQVDRMAALEKLREEGTADALFGLCKRWGVTSSKGVEDEYEKNWVVDVLAASGKSALPPLARYMKEAIELSFALRTLQRITSTTGEAGMVAKSETLNLIDELFASEPPGYTRHPERRIDLIRWLAEWKGVSSDEVVPRLTPYLADFDENARFAAIDGIAHHSPALIAAPLAQALIRPEEESIRIRRTVAEIIAKQQLPLGDAATAAAAVLTGQLGHFRIENGTLRG